MIATNRRRINPSGRRASDSNKGSRIMTATSIGRIVVPSLGLVAACGAVLFVGITHMRRGPPVETRAATAAPAVSPPASGARDEGPLAAVQAEANAVGAALAASPKTDESVPAFDIARIEQTGDAVIAGRAAPGAIVGANRSVPDQAVGSPQAHQPSQPPSQIAKQQDIAISHLPHATAAIPLSDGGSPSAGVGPKIATTVVSRGDSLWRISRVTYGAGMRYAVVYKANHDQIRNPNRIYPGQILVLPMKAR